MGAAAVNVVSAALSAAIGFGASALWFASRRRGAAAQFDHARQAAPAPPQHRQPEKDSRKK
jgi:hypothetical protein